MRAPHSSQPSARDVAALEVSNAALRAQIDELRERIESGGKAALAEASALAPRLEAQAEALASSRRMLDERDAELAASHRECEELRGDAGRLRARCDDLEEQLVRAAGDAEASRAEVHKLVHAHKVAQAVAAATEAVLCDGQEADAGAEVRVHVDAPASEAAKDRGIALQTRKDNVTAGGRGALVVLDSASGSDSEEWSDVDHFLRGGGMSADLKHANNARRQAAIDRQLRGCREALREFHGQGSIAGVRSPLAKRSARLSERRQKLEELEQLQRAHDEAELHELARTDQQRRARQRRDYLANARNLL